MNINKRYEVCFGIFLILLWSAQVAVSILGVSLLPSYLCTATNEYFSIAASVILWVFLIANCIGWVWNLLMFIRCVIQDGRISITKEDDDLMMVYETNNNVNESNHSKNQSINENDGNFEEPPIYDFPLEDSIPPLDYYEKPWKFTDNDDYAEEYNQELIEQVNKRKMRQEDLPIKEQFKMVFDQYKREIEEKVLFDVLIRFYFADWTRQCDYEKMTSEEIVNVAMDVCKKIEKDYHYNIDDDLYPMPWNFTGGDDYE